MSLRIGCVTHHVYPAAQEIRITRLAAAAADAGHRVIVFCPRRDADAAADEFAYGRIRRFGLPGVARILAAPVPVNLLWERWLARAFREEEVDLVLVRDLRLALPAIRAVRRLGVPAILDLGEHYPGMMEMTGKQRLAHHLTRSVRLIAWLERRSVMAADETWVVVEENHDRLAPFARRIEVVNNYPALPAQAPPLRASGRPFTFVSLGLIDNLRGLDLAIDVFARVAGELPYARLLIYGDGFFRLALERQACTLGLDGRIVFGGWIPADRKYEALAEGDVGLLLHRPGELTQHTMPNKLFDYMYSGLPVLATRLKPIRRILEKEVCGLAVDYDATEVAGAMLRLAHAPELCRAMGENGRAAVLARYNWQAEAPKVLAHIARCAGQRPNGEARHTQSSAQDRRRSKWRLS